MSTCTDQRLDPNPTTLLAIRDEVLMQFGRSVSGRCVEAGPRRFQVSHFKKRLKQEKLVDAIDEL